MIGYYFDKVINELAYEDCHAVVGIKNGYMDVNGITTLTQLKNNCFFNNDILKVKIVPIMESELIYCFTMEGINDGQVNNAVDFINENISLYDNR